MCAVGWTDRAPAERKLLYENLVVNPSAHSIRIPESKDEY